MSQSTEREASRPINRPPRVEMTDGRKGTVLIERHQKQGANRVQGRLVDLSRGGVKIALDCCIPFDETVTLTAEFPEIHVEFRVLADVLWSRQADNDTWLIGCSFKPGLPNETVDRLANEGYLERRCSPRYPISCDGAVRWELSDDTVPVKVADFSAEGFCLVAPSVAKTGWRFQLELEDSDGNPVQIAARMCWHSTVEDGYLVGAEFLDRNDSHRLWEIAYQTTPNQPLQLRVPLTPSRWMIAWFAALIAIIIVYPPLVRLLTQHDSIAAEWSSNAVAEATDRHLEASTRPATASPTAAKVTAATSSDASVPERLTDNLSTTPREVQAVAQQDASQREFAAATVPAVPVTGAAATAPERTQVDWREEKKTWQDYQRRQQATIDKQTRELADLAVQLTRREVTLQEEQTEWARRLQRRQRDLDSQRRALLAAQAAWTNKQHERVAKDRTDALAQALLDATAATTPGTAVPTDQPPRAVATEAAEPQPAAIPPTAPPPTAAADRLADLPAAASQAAAADNVAPVTIQPATPTDSVPVTPDSESAVPDSESAVPDSAPRAPESAPPVTLRIAAQPATPQDPAAPDAVPPDLAPPIEPADRGTSAAAATPLDIAAAASREPATPPVTTTPIAADKAALAALRRGRQQLEAGQYAAAADALQQVVQYQPENPLGHYLLALAQYQSGDQDAAEQSIRTGATLERHNPITHWGRTMQRYQGRPRLWLERARREAKKSHAEAQRQTGLKAPSSDRR